MMRDHAENQSDIKRHQCHQRSVFKKNHANWSNDSKNLDGCNLKGCSVFKSPFNELEGERKPRRELSWILRDIREPSWGLLKQDMAKIVPNCQKKDGNQLSPFGRMYLRAAGFRTPCWLPSWTSGTFSHLRRPHFTHFHLQRRVWPSSSTA